MLTLAIAGTGALFAFKWATSFIFLVREKQEVVIESFGKYAGTKTKPGINFKAPWPIQTIRAKVPTDIAQEKAEFKTKAKDGVFVTMPIDIQLRVKDTKKALYESTVPVQIIKQKILEALKSFASSLEFEELYQKRNEFSTRIIQDVGEDILNQYGYEIVDIIVDEPQAPSSVEASYNSVRASEQNLRAAENEAEAEKVQMIKKAEGRKQAQALLGQGIAEQRAAIFKNYSEQFNKLIADGMNAEEASKMMALAMTQDTLRDIGEQGNLIIASGDGASQLANFHSLGQKLNDNRPNPKRAPVTAPKAVPGR